MEFIVALNCVLFSSSTFSLRDATENNQVKKSTSDFNDCKSEIGGRKICSLFEASPEKGTLYLYSNELSDELTFVY